MKIRCFATMILIGSTLAACAVTPGATLRGAESARDYPHDTRVVDAEARFDARAFPEPAAHPSGI